MSQVAERATDGWTIADLFERFGAVPFHRIRYQPAPGTATERDVIEIHDREDRLYELIDGVLVEKTVGYYESYLALLLGRLLGNYVAEKQLGILAGSDGMMRLAPGLVRIPDLSFVSWGRLPQRRVPREPIAGLAPDLAIEVISKSNTPEEMRQKLVDYFSAGVRLVWYIYPEPREVHVFTAAEQTTVLGEPQTLDGGDVLPGFSLSLREYFAEPPAPPAE